MTNGVFDIIHRGHVEFLAQARALGASLVVAINSDESTKRRKGDSRPINADFDRAAVLSGLSAVDYVIVFDEDDASSILLAIRPDIYVKAADYEIEHTPEGRVARNAGVKTATLEYLHGRSTSVIVDRIGGRKRKAAFIDRDGVILLDIGYAYRPEQMQLLPHAIDGLLLLHRLGYQLVIVSNQSGIARGMFTEDDWEQFDIAMCALLDDNGVRIARSMKCPHHPRGTVAKYTMLCHCRKPAPGMITEAAIDLDIDLSASVMIGDRMSDMIAGRAAQVGACCLVTPFVNAPETLVDISGPDLLEIARRLCE